jgi:hypothetical protein
VVLFFSSCRHEPSLAWNFLTSSYRPARVLISSSLTSKEVRGLVCSTTSRHDHCWRLSASRGFAPTPRADATATDGGGTGSLVG